MNDTAQQNHGRTNIILAIKTHLSFFALVLLVGESCLLFIAKDASGIDRTIAIIGIIGMLIFACVAVYSLAFQGSAGIDQFSHQLEGEWWEKINHSQGSQLSFFTITRNLLGDVTLEGTSYDRDGHPCAKWKSEMTKLLPNERRLVYLWRGKHPLPGFAHLNFHGYGRWSLIQFMNPLLIMREEAAISGMSMKRCRKTLLSNQLNCAAYQV